MKGLKKLSILLLAAAMFTSCGDSNKLNPFKKDANGNAIGTGYGYSGNRPLNVSCQYNTQPVSPVAFSVQAVSQHTYAGPMQPAGNIGGATPAVGVSQLGDIIEVRNLGNGTASVVIYPCGDGVLLHNGRNIAAAQANQISVNTNVTCQGFNEVTYADLVVQVPQYDFLQAQWFQMTFSTVCGF